MKILKIPNGWYGDCLPDGKYISVLENSGVQSGNVNTPQTIDFTKIQAPGNNCLFARLNPANGNEFIGKSNSPGTVLKHNGTSWLTSTTPTFGNNPVIYSPTGLLTIIKTENEANQLGTGATGYSYWDDEKNKPIPTDNANGNVTGLAQYVYLGNGLYVGQGLTGGTHVFDGTNIRVLDNNLPISIRKNQDGNNVGLYYYNEDRQFAVAITCTTDELRALPIYVPIVDNFGQTGPASPNGFLVPDTTKFVFGTTNLSRTKDHKIKQIEVSPNLFAYMKFGQSKAYELWAKTSFGVEYLEDASDTAGNIVKRFIRTEWIPKSLKVGYANRIEIPEHDEIWMQRSDCKEVNRVPSVRKIWLLAHYKQFDCGPDLGKREVIAVVYDPTGDAHTPGRYMEVNYFALDIGWLWWQSHKSWIVYASGNPVFNDASLADNKKFYLNDVDSTLPSLSGCALPPPVVVPPSNLVKPEITVINWLPELKDGWEFKAIDRMNPGFEFRLWAENGSFYQSFTNPVGMGRTGATRNYKKCEISPIPPNPTPIPPIPPGTISRITVQGLTFRDELNNIFPYRGFSSFSLLRRFLDGEDINPYLNAWSSIGYNLTRVFSQMDWNAATGLKNLIPADYGNYYNLIPSFLNLLSQHGLYCELVDHTFPYNLNDSILHSDKLSVIGRNHKNYFKELANEPPVNGIDINGIYNGFNKNLINFPWSTGVYEPDAEKTGFPKGTYVGPHLDRGDEWPRKFRQLEEYRSGSVVNGAIPLLCPIVHDEPIGGWNENIPGRRSNVPTDFHSHGAGCQVLGAGGTYHHQSGLDSILPTGLEWECAKSFIKGLRLVNPNFQLGNYTRIGLSDCPIETEQSLGTWGTILGNLSTMVRVRPTGPYTVRSGWKITSEDSEKIVITLART